MMHISHWSLCCALVCRWASSIFLNEKFHVFAITRWDRKQIKKTLPHSNLSNEMSSRFSLSWIFFSRNCRSNIHKVGSNYIFWKQLNWKEMQCVSRADLSHPSNGQTFYFFSRMSPITNSIFTSIHDKQI